MPVRAKLSWSRLVRLVVGRCGTMPMHTHLIVRFGYGGWAPWVTRNENGDLLAIAGPGMLLLRTPAELVGANLTTVGDFVVSAGQRAPFVLTYFPVHLPLPDPVEADDALLSMEDSWTSRASACRSSQQRGEIFTRSLITLKALTYAPTGGFIAASTSSLPEQLGGPRNWDYRFCWLRDVTLTLLALMNTRIYDEARAWRDWLLRAAAGSPTNIQIMYGAAGERLLAKCEVSWLRGYENSKPVRVGNVAVDQLQLDVLGEVMDALHQGRAGELQSLAAAWNFQFALLAHLETAWRAPDEGIWEVRSGRQHYSHSKVMAWVAFDRGIKAVEAVGLDGQTD